MSEIKRKEGIETVGVERIGLAEKGIRLLE